MLCGKEKKALQVGLEQSLQQTPSFISVQRHHSDRQDFFEVLCTDGDETQHYVKEYLLQGLKGS